MELMLLFAQADPLSGGAGWVGAGLLGLVLGWLLWVHLPSKDKQFKEMIVLGLEQTEKDRAHRHELMNRFQAALTEVVNKAEKDSEKDRAAYLLRSERYDESVRLLAAELRAAMMGACRYAPTQPPERRDT